MEVEENKWGLVRTNNGEWISEMHTEVLNADELFLFNARAARTGKKLDVHYGYCETGEQYTWVYKNDIEELLNQ